MVVSSNARGLICHRDPATTLSVDPTRPIQPKRTFVANRSVYASRTVNMNGTWDNTDFVCEGRVSLKVKTTTYNYFVFNVGGGYYETDNEFEVDFTGNGQWQARFSNRVSASFFNMIINLWGDTSPGEVTYKAWVKDGTAYLEVYSLDRDTLYSNSTTVNGYGPNTDTRIAIGARSASGGEPAGDIDVLWSRLTSAGVVLADYNFENLPESATEGVFLDQSGQANNLTVTNGYQGMIGTTGDAGARCTLNEDGYSDAAVLIEYDHRATYPRIQLDNSIRTRIPKDVTLLMLVRAQRPEPYQWLFSSHVSWTSQSDGITLDSSNRQNIRGSVATVDNGRVEAVSAGNYPPDGNLHWVGLRYDGSEVAICIDGVWGTSSPATGNINWHANLVEVFIGNLTTASTGYAVDAAFYRTLMFNRALSDAEVSAYVTDRWIVPQSGNVLDLDCRSNTFTDGTVLSDASPSGWDAVIKGTVETDGIGAADLSTGTPPTHDVFGNDLQFPGRHDGSFLMAGGSQIVGNGSFYIQLPATTTATAISTVEGTATWDNTNKRITIADGDTARSITLDNGNIYDCCEGSGNVIHDRVNGENGTVVNSYVGQWGTVPSPAANPATQQGCRWALNGDGIAGFITTPVTYEDVPTGRIEMKMTPWDMGDFQGVCGFGVQTSLAVIANWLGTWATTGPLAAGAVAMEFGKTVDIEWSWSGTTQTLKIDGVQSATGTFTPPGTAEQLLFGIYNARYFAGEMFDIKLYDSVSGGNLLREWKLNDGEDARWNARSYVQPNVYHTASEPVPLTSLESYWYAEWYKCETTAQQYHGIVYADLKINAYVGNASGNMSVLSEDGAAQAIVLTGEMDKWCLLFYERNPTTGQSAWLWSPSGGWVSGTYNDRLQAYSELTVEVGRYSSLGDRTLTGDVSAVMAGTGYTASLADIRDTLHNNGLGLTRGELTDQQRQDFGIVLESYGDDASGDRYSVTGPNMTAVGTPGRVASQRAGLVRETVAGDHGVMSATGLEWATVADANGIPPASGRDLFLRDRLLAQHSAEAVGALPWAAAKDQTLVLDGSGNGNNGTVTGYASELDIVSNDVPPELAGTLTRSMHFDANTTVLTGSVVTLTGEFSVFVRFKCVAPTNRVLLMSDGAGEYTFYWNSGEFAVKFGPTFDGVAFTTADALDGEWHTALVRRDSANEITLRFDGGADLVVATIAGNKSINCFNGYTNGNFDMTDGNMSDVRIYDADISDDEALFIETVGASGTDPTTTNLVGHWGGTDSSLPYRVDAWPNGRPFADSLSNGEGINGIDRSRTEVCGADVMEDQKRFEGELTKTEYDQAIDF